MKKLNHKGAGRGVHKPAVIYPKGARPGLSLIFLLSLLSLLYPDSWALAKIFKYVDSNGITHFSNAPGGGRYQEWKKVAESYKDGKRMPTEKNKDKIAKVVELASKKYGVSSDLVKAVIKAESNFNPWAISAKGAMGMMQLMPETARQYGVEDPFDPWENIHGGVRHLDYLLTQYNHDIERALAAYNAGKGWVEQYNGVPPFPETIDYINRVIYYYQNPGALHSKRLVNHHKKVKRANKIFVYVSPGGVVLFTNVRQ